MKPEIAEALKKIGSLESQLSAAKFELRKLQDSCTHSGSVSRVIHGHDIRTPGTDIWDHCNCHDCDLKWNENFRKL